MPTLKHTHFLGGSLVLMLGLVGCQGAGEGSDATAIRAERDRLSAQLEQEQSDRAARESELAQAQAEIERLQSDMREAQTQMSEAQMLAVKNDQTAAELQSAKADLAKAQARVRELEASLNAARANRTNAAPALGNVSKDGPSPVGKDEAMQETPDVGKDGGTTMPATQPAIPNFEK